MEADVESDIYACEACKQVFKDSRKPTECPRCQSSEIFKTNLEQLTLRQLRKIISSSHLTLRQLRKIISSSHLADFFSRRHYLYYLHRVFQSHDSEILRQIIPTAEEVKQKEIERQELLKQKEIERQELLKQGYCPHCKVPIVLLMLDCPQCKRPYEAEVKSDVFFIN